MDGHQNRIVMQSISIPFFVVDRNFEIIWANPAFFAATGRNENVIGKKVFAELMRLPKAPRRCPIKRCLYTGREERGVMTLAISTERVLRADVSCWPAMSPEGEEQAVCMLEIDTRDRSDVFSREFFAAVGHRFRGMLTAIQGFSTFIVENDSQNLSEQQYDMLKRVSLNSRNAIDYIEDVFMLMQLEAGLLKPAEEDCDVADILAMVAASFRPQVRKKGISLSVEINPQIPSKIRTDGRLLARILSQFVANALVHTPEGGAIVLSAVPRGSNLALSVADTGIGISQARLETVFRPFAGAGRSRSGETRGIGLALAKRLSELIDVDIDVESQVAKGSVFSVIFKKACRIRRGESRSTSSSRLPAAREAVLVLLESSSDNYLMLKTLLPENQYRLFTAANAGECAKLVAEKKPDMVIVDPKAIAGQDQRLLERLKTPGAEGQRTQIIALSDEPAGGGRDVRPENGFDDVISRNACHREIAEKIKLKLKKN